MINNFPFIVITIILTDTIPLFAYIFLGLSNDYYLYLLLTNFMLLIGIMSRNINFNFLIFYLIHCFACVLCIFFSTPASDTLQYLPTLFTYIIIYLLLSTYRYHEIQRLFQFFLLLHHNYLKEV